MSSKLYQYSTLLALMTVATLVAPCKHYTTVVSERDSVRQKQIAPRHFIPNDSQPCKRLQWVDIVTFVERHF